MDKLVKYLESNLIPFEKKSKKMIMIAGQKFELVRPDEEGKIFSPSFVLMADPTKANNYVFEFGGKYYYTPAGTEDDPSLKSLRYLGECTKKQAYPNFIGVRGGFELLNGSGQYRDWAAKAKFLGAEALGICEKNTLAGALKFQTECNNKGLKAIIGETVTVKRDSDELMFDVKVYAKSDKGFRSILLINKQIKVDELDFIYQKEFLKLLEDVYVVLDPKTLKFEDIFPLDLQNAVFYQLDTAEYIDNEVDKDYLLNLEKYIKSDFEPIAISDAFYIEKEYNHIKPILNGIGKTHFYVSENQHYKTWDEYSEEVRSLFKDEDKANKLLKRAGKNLNKVVSVCTNFSIPIGARHLPKYKLTKKETKKYKTKDGMFWGLIDEGMKRKIPKKKHKEYMKRIHTEFDVIEYGDVMDYFLILYDVIKWCRKKDILVGIGRGSAGGSLVSYLMDITQLDPIEYGLLFERFLNRGRIEKSLPDIDVDFPGRRRSEVKEYIEKRYGAVQVCSVGTYGALQLRAAIKDIGKQYKVNFDETNRMTANLGKSKTFEDIFRRAAASKTVMDFIKKYPYVINDVPIVLGQPKSHSIHACAMMVFPKERTMYEWAPVRRDGDLIVSEWEGGELEMAGFLKEDILGVLQLDKFENIMASIKEATGEEIDIYNIPLKDKKVFEFFRKGWNGDCFHFGSSGLTGYCQELLPENMNDLIAAISLYRPGAMENNFHNEYVLRKNGDRDVEYFTGAKDILKDTYGVFVFQEQIMKLCQVLGGLSLIEADDVRKAMVKKKFEALHQYKERFLPNYVKEFGVSQQYAEGVWDAIDRAATYLFNKSHAAAYSITGYWSQWFKVHYPVHYWCVAIQEASDDEDYANFINEVTKTGDIEIKQPDINESALGVRADHKNKKIYWSIANIKNVGDTAVKQIVEDRDKDGAYFSLQEFYTRHKFTGTKVNKRTIECLILAGAFDQVEGVSNPTKRRKLVKEYRKIASNGTKIDPEKDWFTLNRDNIMDEQWWILQQKMYSGIAYFDYSILCDKIDDDAYKFCTVKKFMRENSAGNKVKVGGYLHEIKIRETKKGKWASIVLECNYEFIKLQVWAEQFHLLGSDFTDKTKGVMIVSGVVKYDSKYSKQNNLQTQAGSSVIILK